jgi:hypothetical protein
MLRMCVYMHSRFVENHPIRILQDGPLISEGVLSQWLLENFGVSVTIPTHLLSDSTCVISIARDMIKHELTKHIDVDAHFT